MVAGRDNYQDRAFERRLGRRRHRAGLPRRRHRQHYGRYHALLNNASVCGPATSRWPGGYRANQWGHLNDFRVGLGAAAEAQVRPGDDGAGEPAHGRLVRRRRGVAVLVPGVRLAPLPRTSGPTGPVRSRLTRTFRRVADEHGLVFIVNGTWGANDGGGYPDASRSRERPGRRRVRRAPRRRARPTSGPTHALGSGPRSHPSPGAGPSTTRSHTRPRQETSTPGPNCYAYVNQQSDYGRSPSWGSSHATGLPTRVR